MAGDQSRKRYQVDPTPDVTQNDTAITQWGGGKILPPPLHLTLAKAVFVVAGDHFSVTVDVGIMGKA
jgi:hypothetical protein